MTTVMACGSLAGAVLAVPFSALAQDSAGGLLMQLRLGERFVSRDTSSPLPTQDGTTTQLVTDLGLAISSETRTQSATLDFNAGLRFFDGPTTDRFERDFTDPSLRLGYAQVAAASSFTSFASATLTDLAQVNPLSLVDTQGNLARDFSQLTDGGQRTALGFGGTYTWRDDAPFGMTVTLNVDDISYSDLPLGTTLDDSTSFNFSPTARFDISDVLQANLGLRYLHTDFDTDADVTRYALNADASLARPNGAIGVQFGISDGDGGVQTTLGASRSYVLPETTARFGLGLSSSSGRDIYLTGNASLKHDFAPSSAFGTFTANASRDVTLDGRTNAEVVTSLSVATDYALSPVATLLLSADLGQAEETDSGDTVDLSGLNLTVNYDLSRDWRATAGLRTTSRDPSNDVATTSTTLSLGVSRQFDVRP